MHSPSRYTILPFMLVALATSASAFAQTAPPNSMFEQMDTNRDGRISLEESTAAAQATFKRMDRNHDGKLSADEFSAAHPSGTGQSEAAANDNNAVAQTLFDRLDANHDGVISESEMRDAHGRRVVPPAANAAPAAGATTPAQLPEKLSGLGARMDANHDGFISASEHATAARTRFDRIDSNHDGFISHQELDAAHGVKTPAAGH